MWFYSVDIENFRGFKKINISDLKRVNLFVGKNNSGKTSVMEAIFLSIGVNNPELITRIDLMRDLRHNEADDFRFVFFDLDYKNTPIINTQFLSPSEYRSVKILPIKNQSSTHKNILEDHTSSDIYKEETTSINTADDPVEGISISTNIKTVKTSKGKKIVSKIYMVGNVPKFETPKNYEEKLFGIYIKNSRFSRLYERIDKIIYRKEQEWIIETLQQIDPRITDIVLGNRMIYLDIGLEMLVPCNIMGDGIITVLSILAAIANAKDGFIMVDEVDNGLHYSSMETLWKAIDFATQKYNVQAFITTHSLECTMAFARTFEGKEDENRLFRIEKVNQSHKVIKYDNSDLLTFLNENWEIR